MGYPAISFASRALSLCISHSSQKGDDDLIRGNIKKLEWQKIFELKTTTEQ